MDVLVTDETSAGDETARLLLAGVPTPITLRELIRFRVREEVARHNAAPDRRYAGLVRPRDAEATRDGYLLATARRLDWEQQADAAIAAFERNGFFVFADDRQYDELDAEVPLSADTVVTFVRLVPLVGG